jgi:hypothetical protein
VPLAVGDTTTITEAGDVGEDVEDLLLQLPHAVNRNVPPAQASPYRGYYTAKYRGPGYSCRKYWYWSMTYGGYRSHYAVYSPQRPRYVYYYNPYKGRYWGRYDLAAGGYSTLAPPDRKPQLGQIPESAFPPPGPMPPAEPGGEEMPSPPEAGPGTPPGALTPGGPAEDGVAPARCRGGRVGSG